MSMSSEHYWCYHKLTVAGKDFKIHSYDGQTTTLPYTKFPSNLLQCIKIINNSLCSFEKKKKRSMRKAGLWTKEVSENLNHFILHVQTLNVQSVA